MKGANASSNGQYVVQDRLGVLKEQLDRTHWRMV